MAAQIFKRNANGIVRVSIIGAILLVAAVVAAGVGLYLSPYYTDVGVSKDQPVPFSHKHHVDQLKINCQYCHASVEQAAYAGYPPTDTCMSCHSQIWTNSPLLQPVRDSYRTGEPILWNKIYDLPDFVYFNHSIHVAKGIGCSSCHGAIHKQQLAAKVQPLYMGWCLGCHRNPEQNVRPQSEIYNMDWTPPANQEEVGKILVAEYNIQSPERLTDCYICHR